MNYILKNNDLDSEYIGINDWPIVTDDNFEAASFLLVDSKKHLDLLVRHN